MDVAHEIAVARHRSGLTQRELAERAGTSQATLSAYEAGRKHPSAETFARLLAAAGSRLTVETDVPPVVSPGAAELARRGRILKQVIEFAEGFPVKHSPTLRYPRLADIVAQRDAAPAAP